MTDLQIEREGALLQAELRGRDDAPLVIFSHGGWMDRRMFDAQVEPVVAAGYQALTWDLRGHGESSRGTITQPAVADLTADLIAVLDAAKQEKPALLVGQSLGGMISQHAALTNPERVAGLVTIGAPCINPHNQRLARRMATMWRMSRYINEILPTPLVLRGMARWTALDPEVQEYVRVATRNTTKESIRWVMKATDDVARVGRDISGDSIGVPVLIIRGDRDTSGAGRLTAKTAPDWVRRDPDARYEVIPRAGHQAHQDQPGAFNEALVGFLDTVRH